MTKPASAFTAERLSKTGTFVVQAPIDEAFPLFGPVRERLWAKGWNPTMVFPPDTDVCEKQVFQTRGGLHGSEETFTWTVVRYEPLRYFIEYQVTTPSRLWFITVACRPLPTATSVSVTYTYTGLTPEGNAQNADALRTMFAHDLKDWEQAINDYLRPPTSPDS